MNESKLDMTKIIAWANNLEVGIDFIDQDHIQLIDVINEVYELIEVKAAAPQIAKAFNKLSAVTLSHFAHEEQKMAEIHYKYEVAHRAEHKKLINEFKMLKMKFDATNVLSETTSMFLRDWLLKHIATVDAAFAEAIRQAEQIVRV